MIKFTIEGDPVAKGRPRFAKRGNFISTYTPAKTKTYEESVALAAQYAMDGLKPLEGPLTALIFFYMPIPKSSTKAFKTACNSDDHEHAKKPDLDNLFKSVTDGMNGIVYVDDSQITVAALRKVYSENPRVEVEIHVNNV